MNPDRFSPHAENAATAKASAQMNKKALWYNQTLNVFWSVLNFSPLGYFCFAAMELKWIYILSGLSLAAGFLPRSFFDAMQLGKTTALYEKIGIRVVKKLTQDGDFINRSIRKKFPQYKKFTDRSSIQQHLNKAYAIEKIHFSMFVFFLLTSMYALVKGYVWWAAIITINNLVFNLYPNLLQQYNRLRLRRMMKKDSMAPSS